MGGEYVVELGLHKGQSRKTTFILHIANYLYHSSLSQFHIFKEAGNKNLGCCHKAPLPSYRVCLKGKAMHAIAFDFIVT